ncbi:AraC family transcriptional regulator [Vibrio sp. 10N.222.54.F12]|uniref:AraC family transcriptional regulator n=1 Tax=Vibrio TaxID=662 RepID=UPI000C84F980|nr:AraC family transcriptional regulator [Vibrio tasmaniensis]PML17388.1 AraC family transcriptional regulator [Vibrio tasmaniensis]PML45129.1 AraC family transcriptional regulator [Vibrio tasmaniensis]
MNFAIEYTSAYFSHLVITPRKKVLKHSLVSVQSGLGLIKLGKQEYAVEPGQSVWVPYDCLTSLTYFPNTQINRVDFSVRLTDSFPRQAGYVTQTNLSSALLEKLEVTKSRSVKTNNTEQAFKDMLTVLKQEVLAFKPLLCESALSQRFNQWNVDDSNLPQEHTLVMVMREAKKRMQSGQKRTLVIDDLFSGKEEEFEQLCMLVFGEDL